MIDKEIRKPALSWFARFKAWWNRPVDMSRPGYNDPRFAIPCHKPSVVPPSKIGPGICGICFTEHYGDCKKPLSNASAVAFDICKMAADLSAVTGVSPGEALEMIRKAGNFGSQEEIDRLAEENRDLRRDNIKLLEKLAAHRLGESISGEVASRLPPCLARTSAFLSGSDVEIVLLIRGDIIKGIDGRLDTQDIEMLIHGPELSQPTTMRWRANLSFAPLSFTFGASKGEPHPYELTLKQSDKPKPSVRISDSNVGLHEETHDTSIQVDRPAKPKPQPPAPETDDGKLDTFQKAYMGVPFKEDESG